MVSVLRVLFAALMTVSASAIASAQQSGAEVPATAQTEVEQPVAAPLVRQILVEGNQRVEADTVLSYLLLQPGQPFDSRLVNLSIQTLMATGLFSDVQFEDRGQIVLVRVQENPIINRVILEGNSAIDDEKITDEIQAQPRAIFTRSRVQSDVQRIIEVYRRSGRFAATVTPKIVEQPQNRVDLIFEISEGPVTGVRRINIIGNESYSDRRLRRELVTRESRWWRFFSSNDNYDPDRLEYDRELLRQFYSNQGYANFRVLSAVAELTPDQRDFYITITIDEGEIYNFGEVTVSTEIPDLNPDFLQAILPVQEGDLFQGQLIEDSIDALTFSAGAAGYAFVNIRPLTTRNREDRTVDVEFVIDEGPRVYIERIDISGNTRTLDRVIRRELDIVEGDAFNQVLIDRSRNNIRRLGFFEEVEVEETPGSAPDRARVNVAVSEQPTGELAFGAGFSSTDSFLIDLSISERNLRGRGQFLRFRISASSNRESLDIRFTEPRFLDRNLAAGFDLFRVNSDFLSEASFQTESTGASLRLGFPVTASTNLQLGYTYRTDNVLVYSSASSALLNQAGSRATSVLTYTLNWSRLNDPIEPSNGYRLQFTQGFAGIGGDVRYVRSEFNGAIYRPFFPGLLGDDVVASFTMNGGFVLPWGGDSVRINDRFFKGGNSFRGFEVAGIGPRAVSRDPDTGELIRGDALGGRLYAVGALEVSFPLGLPEQYGVRGSLFTEFGTLGMLDSADQVDEGTNAVFTVDDLALRASAGLSIFWDSPFGPVRFDFAQAFIREDYDRAEFFRFSTRTGF
ncbi:outer membrane protein assembly factor BamA [Maricaulis maris]|jgi:outer membrane protein insertion porin family|uniref:Outer membrane protein assembly factor BamA n=1 Tax=Maricaulis maris (strain MCS10) TaxID=394221 RepID=Q0APV7_MARMM|nr:outer membrane protein assembly factor BamA [Maricaulis maris]ABI65680.1 surface antigen (D15) [Maricaulis maris MCS10]